MLKALLFIVHCCTVFSLLLDCNCVQIVGDSSLNVLQLTKDLIEPKPVCVKLQLSGILLMNNNVQIFCKLSLLAVVIDCFASNLIIRLHEMNLQDENEIDWQVMANNWAR